MQESIWFWIAFNIFIIAALVLDLGLVGRNVHVIRFREAAIRTAVWFAMALCFALGLYWFMGSEASLTFLTGYLIEDSLSVDNIFVFLTIFSYFGVPSLYQHRVLFWGILGALVMRAIFIAAGAALLSAFHWIIYIFGGFLIVTGIKMLSAGDEKIEPEKNPAVRLLRRCDRSGRAGAPRAGAPHHVRPARRACFRREPAETAALGEAPQTHASLMSSRRW